MAKSGDVLTNPNGELLRFVQTAADTNGELLQMEVTYVPESDQPPEHYHPYQEESFTVLAGEFVVGIDGEEHTFAAGDSFVVPAGANHWMKNVSDEEGKLSWQVRPALDTESFFETMWTLANSDEIDENGVPELLQVAVTLREFSREYRLTKPSYGVQRVVFGALAPIARLRGYKARHSPADAEA